MISVSEKHQALVIPFRKDVEQLVPSAKGFIYNGDKMLALRHSRDEVRLLRNLGVNVPAPILHHYDWPGPTPFETQKKTAALLSTVTRAYVLSQMGTGKTLAALYAADFLMDHGDVNKGLIVAPLSTLNPVWFSEIFKTFTDKRVVVLYGTRKKRLELLADTSYDFYVINHDGIHIIKEAMKKRKDIDLIIIDELTAFRTKRTERWKTMNQLCKGRKFIWGLTGAPTPNEPTDAWAQVRLLTPNNVPAYYTQFRDQTMRQITQFRWLPLPDANDTVYKAMQPSVRFKRDECIDLPPTTYSDRSPELSDTQKKFYKIMMSRLQVEYAAHRITAANEGVKLSKLLQICMGWVYTDQGTTLALDPAQRLALLDEIYEQTENKLIIFVPFVHAVKQVYNHMLKHGPVGLVYGDTNKKERDRIFYSFQHAESPRVIVAHPKTMSHGLTLTAADTTVWYSPTVSNEIYEQANARTPRPGQKNKTFIIHVASSPIERRVYKRLQTKGSMQGALLDMFKGVDEGL